MKKKHKLFGLLMLACASFLFLAACSKADSKDSSKSSSSSTSQSSSSTSSSSSSSGSSASKASTVTDKKGTFSGLNSNKVSGTVTVSKNKVSLSNFKTDEGPDLKIYLTKDGNVKSGKVLKKIDLKAESQSFDVPSGVDVSQYNSVVIWCDKAHVGFGEAKLA
ncbi:DM13 domain-containing protein [Lactococcus termiticola]|uniref:DM13 domain-containing protein n=1 Tax=Lactococcus termiticola TaxID=2169526 RepID=A0A2R5HGM6_9LACT|nr:DM13 domain-containing protein [Lactococcus termiticola]GBG97213.1 hypothetical protein NtB2_01351 [Lactococcus termiticola]